MSCRERGGGRLATALARDISGLNDVQVLTTLHRLNREAADVPDLPQPTREEVNQWATATIEAALAGNPNMSEGRRQRLQQWAEQIAQEELPSPQLFHAWQNLKQTALFARYNLGEVYTRLGRQLGMNPNQIKEQAAQFAQNYTSASRQDRTDLELSEQDRTRLFSELGDVTGLYFLTPQALSSNSPLLPQDGATLYTLSRLLEQTRSVLATNPGQARRRGIDQFSDRFREELAHNRYEFRLNQHDVRVVCEYSISVDCDAGCGVHTHYVVDLGDNSNLVEVGDDYFQRDYSTNPASNPGWPVFSFDENDELYDQHDHFEICRGLGRCPYCGQFVSQGQGPGQAEHECQYAFTGQNQNQNQNQNQRQDDQARTLEGSVNSPGNTPAQTPASPVRVDSDAPTPTDVTLTLSGTGTIPIPPAPASPATPVTVNNAPSSPAPDPSPIRLYEFGRASSIAASVYDPSTERLDIEFRRARAIPAYRYTGVPLAVVEELERAVSPVRYYNQNIRSHYPSQRIVNVADTLRGVGRGGAHSTTDDTDANTGQATPTTTTAQQVAAQGVAADTLARSTRASQAAQRRVARAQSRQGAQQEQVPAQTASTAIATAPTSGPRLYRQDMAAFQAVYDQAKARKARGEPPVPLMTGPNVTGGLGARNGGRGFGIELEFDLQGVANRQAALAAIGRELHQAGLTRTPNQEGYHSAGQDYSMWRFERDSSVDGEIVSPILYDEPDSWEKIAKVCEIVKRHGGKATPRTGGHVHVSCSDYDHTPANHNRLLRLFKQNEDVLYRLAQNPTADQHRGMRYCRPNNEVGFNYRSVEEVRSAHGNRELEEERNAHRIALNFQGVRGRATDHVEYRLWDGTLDPATIQAQVTLSLALTHHAFAQGATATTTGAGALAGVGVGTTEANTPSLEPLGSHRRANQTASGRPRQLRGEEWEADTRSFRQLVDDLFAPERAENKQQLTALFAVTKWQERRV